MKKIPINVASILFFSISLIFFGTMAESDFAYAIFTPMPEPAPFLQSKFNIQPGDQWANGVVVPFECDDGDEDEDGLCDEWENSGVGIAIEYDGITYELSCDTSATYLTDPTGATVCPDPNYKDIYVEIDFFKNHEPTVATIQSVVSAFSNYTVDEDDIQVHLFLDEKVWNTDSQKYHDEAITRFDKPITNVKSPDRTWKNSFGTLGERISCDPTVAGNCDPENKYLTAKAHVFHYGVFVHKPFIGSTPVAGAAEMPGNQFMVKEAGVFSAEQIKFLQHELCHNISVDHDDIDDVDGSCDINFQADDLWVIRQPDLESGPIVEYILGEEDSSQFKIDANSIDYEIAKPLIDVHADCKGCTILDILEETIHEFENKIDRHLPKGPLVESLSESYYGKPDAEPFKGNPTLLPRIQEKEGISKDKVICVNGRTENDSRDTVKIMVSKGDEEVIHCILVKNLAKFVQRWENFVVPNNTLCAAHFFVDTNGNKNLGIPDNFLRSLKNATSTTGEKLDCAAVLGDRYIPVFTNETTVLINNRTSVKGCDDIDDCFSLHDVTIKIGGSVKWINKDVVVHTVTSGSVSNGLDGFFDSGILNSEESFEFTFDNTGKYDYFCAIHPWKAGSVTVVDTPVEQYK